MMSHVGVDAWIAGPSAAVTERCQTDQRPATVDDVCQRTTAVTLYITHHSPLECHPHNNPDGECNERKV